MKKIERLEAELHSRGVKTLRSKANQSYFLVIATSDTVASLRTIKKYYPKAVSWRQSRLFENSSITIDAAWEQIKNSTESSYDVWVGQLKDAAARTAWCIYDK